MKVIISYRKPRERPGHDDAVEVPVLKASGEGADYESARAAALEQIPDDQLLLSYFVER
ncbi:hypothetical protein [Pseudoclavibacter sp. CFCC 13796]|uniref:hypothetical protein n=1 Tax=Pseudoclavibacter sp. CFCC 13796 TaxID=2615179 RepID=UPI001787D06F|nr:hypothetical protein [Pseudoclavibacter sp. CFCC 13796]